jgi:hypothetical protein
VFDGSFAAIACRIGAWGEGFETIVVAGERVPCTKRPPASLKF